MILTSLKRGQVARIVTIKADGGLKRRMMDMGIVIGEPVCVEKIAPFGGPIEILIKGYHLSLRRMEAEMIVLEDVQWDS